MVELTAAHWVYLLGILTVLVTMTLRMETPLVCIVSSFVLALVTTGSLIGAVQAVFNAIQVAFSELLGIVLIISIIVAMAKMLEETGIADQIFSPFRAMLKGPSIAFWVMGVVIMISAWLLWPSPAIALVGALLLPAALKVSLPPIGAAMAISMFGYGVALTTDFVIQGAPSIAAKAAGVDVTDVMMKSLPMVIVWAAIALPLSFLSVRKEIQRNGGKPIESDLFACTPEEQCEIDKWTAAAPGFKKVIPWVIGLMFALNIIPIGKFTAALVQSVVGGITGLDGSGFSGLPLVGSLAQVLGAPSDLDMPTLTALGQFFCIAVGGGCIVPWALIPAAGITGTDPVEVARRNLIPTLAGLLGVSVVSIFML